MRDLKPHVFPVLSLVPQAVTAATNGTGIDLRDFGGALAMLSVGALGGTSTPTVTFRVEESDDDSTYTAVADADLDGGANGIVISAANANASSILTRTYMGGKRYIRWACSAVSGSSPTIPASGVIVRGFPHAYLGS